MRLFIINSLLFLATTSTLAIPVTRSSQDGSISLYRSISGAANKNVAVPSSPTIPHTLGRPGSDQMSIVRRARLPPRKDGRPRTGGLRPKPSTKMRKTPKRPKNNKWTHKKKKSGGGAGGGGGGGDGDVGGNGDGGAAGGAGITA